MEHTGHRGLQKVLIKADYRSTLQGVFLFCNTLICRHHQPIEKDGIHNTPFSSL